MCKVYYILIQICNTARKEIINFNLLYVSCREIEHKVIAAAAVIGKVKPVDLVVRVKGAILRSANPGGITHMRTVEALRQEYVR